MFELIKRIRKVKGAGYSEIMLILSLISMISVASFKTFGNTAHHQVSGLSYELSGQTYQGRSDGDSESKSATSGASSSTNAQSSNSTAGAGLSSSSSSSSTSAETSQSSNDRVLTPVTEPNSSDANAADTSTTTQDSTTAANQSSSNTSGTTQVGTSNQEESLIETLARNVSEFSSGFATGLKQQGTDLLNMFLHPVQTVQDMAALVTMLKDDPKQVLTAMLEELGEDAKKLLSGDARNIGEVAGKYFTPAMITKVVTKLKALGKAANKASTNDIDRTPSCCCFAKGTPVSTPEGFKAIDQLRIGDLVQSKNEFTGEMQSKPVSNLFLTKGKQLYALTTLNSNGLKETVEVTDNHPYWVEGEWIESAKLQQGMVLTDEAGQKVEVVQLQELGKTQDTYNIEVADFHTYFVGESKVLVHNECACKLNESPALKDSDYNPDVVDER
ncbi:MAG: polymorphic toxin-type HINT domain-containing protein, partial [Pseudomonadota bacterium]|nr:polymorphic toxin-type HINT domain-containing protein [Pseudomonadota bacterium]